MTGGEKVSRNDISASSVKIAAAPRCEICIKMAVSSQETTKIDDKIADFDDLKNQVTSKLHKREQERLEDVEKKRSEKEYESSAKETTDFFNENFTKERVCIENELAQTPGLTKPALQNHFDKLMISVQNLQKFVSDSTMFLPSYEVRHAQDSLSKLQNEITEKRDELLPKKKFAFKAKKKVAEKGDVTKPDVVDGKKKEFVNVAHGDCGFKDLSDETLSLSSTEINAKDVALSRLMNCKIVLKGAPSTVHVDKLSKCTMLCGPVSGSIFVNDCTDCTFVIACQQLRTHSTTRTSFYLHVTSRGIIEDCNGVTFAPYNLEYPGLDEHYLVAGLDRARNSWDDIDDFNWLASDKRSPNWSLIPENERTKSWM
ncbi:tubulin-specific chaperone C-like [Lineus longissimus]|uniref:tubulin-specific chaperone C-like n=1 Tax=Lineus longissimus TaxID=88925 RepID=UPI00315CCC89